MVSQATGEAAARFPTAPAPPLLQEEDPTWLTAYLVSTSIFPALP